MRRLLACLIALIGIALVCPVLAQPGPGGGTKPQEGKAPVMGGRVMDRSEARSMLFFMRLYNRQTVTTVKGAVESLGVMPPRSRGSEGGIRRVVLKTGQGPTTVFLGVIWYLEQQQVSLKPGDQLEVTGSKVTLGQQPAIIAKEFKVDGRTIVLTNDRGIPVWSGVRGQSATPAK
jgi:hypothetical protein